MKVLLLNGNDDEKKLQMDTSIGQFAACLQKKGHVVTNLLLRKKIIKDCIGCFACWVKTPGVCVIEDDMENILRAMISSDVIIYSTNIEHFMVSPVFKAVLDRQIPLSCAYLRVKNGRMSHYPRYASKQKVMLLVENHQEMEEADIDAISYMLTRGNEDNYLGTFRINETIMEAADAISAY